ncbi:thioredoxin family protein [Candidatus Parcubacteria bacterium]|nr:thioredoxin family protein [Patescibacteria group bacterium]MBU4309904.1 thioredoxin family protein [Patescibacteria group bacterium]MBU4577829.1 thioredoxin family protein [Patescibacteria group bacterium]MCG2696890.1 thioredoxin family protein [Candidatus Parcubacteria bacterium]
MFKKIILTIIVLAGFWGANAQAVENKKIDLYFFYGQGCPHCAKEEIFLAKLEETKSNLVIHRYEVWYNKDNADLLAKVAKSINLNVSGVPILFVGTENVVGYGGDESTGKDILKTIKYYEDYGCTDIIAPIIGNVVNEKTDCIHDCAGGPDCPHNCGCSAKTNEDTSATKVPEAIKVPFIGEIKIASVSLPVLTIMIAAVDGFNPCAMWVLIFLISLLLKMENRRRMWILGAAFIGASGAVYFLFLSAWLNLFIFIGYVFWIRLLIALVALGSGGYHLYDFWKNRNGGCIVEGGEKRRAVFERIRHIISERHFYLALGGIMLLAVAVNMVELVCSIGLPAVYTQVLALSNLPSWQYYSYLFLYIIIFMLDDMIIFVLAMKTLKIKAISSKYSRWSGLIGGIVMFIIGVLLIFKPGWLMF